MHTMAKLAYYRVMAQRHEANAKARAEHGHAVAAAYARACAKRYEKMAKAR